MSPLFNQGILELAKAGIVSSTTVMVKRKYVRPQDFKNLKTLSVGLHLELKERDSLVEMERQLKKFIKLFRNYPSHLDGHKHLHITPSNLPKVTRLAKKYGLPIRSVLAKDRQKIRKAGLKTPNKYISWHPQRKLKMFEALRENKSSPCELVCHLGYYDKRSSSAYNRQRQQELKILKSRQFQKIIKKFEIINYYGL